MLSPRELWPTCSSSPWRRTGDTSCTASNWRLRSSPAHSRVDLVVLDLTWVNGRNGTLLVTHGKTASARRVLPMTPRVRSLLEHRWAAAGKLSEGWIWPASTQSGHVEGSSIKKQHIKALRLSGLRPFVLYSLRHTFLTRLGASGCDAWTLARIAGHSSIAISSRYVHPSEDAVLNAIARLGRHNSGHTENSATTATVPTVSQALELGEF